MTVAANSPRIQPTTDGTTTSFTCSFAILDRGHLRVYLDDVLQSEGADYSLTGTVNREGRNGFESGFSVVMAVAPAASEVLTIYRVLPKTQESRYYGGDSFRAEVPERSWDKLTMIAQDLSELLGLTVKPGVTTPDVGDGASPQIIPVGNALLFGIQVDNADGTYKAVEVEWDGISWYALDQPITTEDLGEVNGCQDTEVGDVVISYPLVNSTAGVTYRFETIQSCDDESGNPDPEQSSPYYRLTDCASTEPDIVTSANLTRLVGAVVSSGGDCYTVSEETDGTGAVTGVSVSSAWSSCSACDDATGPTLPELVNVYAQLAQCSDDELVDYWLPEIQFGLPGDEDLTKIYEYLGVCYYVTNIRADTPGTLLPSGSASVWDDCDSCEDPCDTGDVIQTVDVTVAGLVTLASANGTYTYSTRSVNADGLSVWTFSRAGPSATVVIYLNCDTENVAIYNGLGTCGISLAPRQFAVGYESQNTSVWASVSSDVGMSAAGQLTGSQGFTGDPCHGADAAETFTITIE